MKSTGAWMLVKGGMLRKGTASGTGTIKRRKKRRLGRPKFGTAAWRKLYPIKRKKRRGRR
jgi:hypothetical protein